MANIAGGFLSPLRSKAANGTRAKCYRLLVTDGELIRSQLTATLPRLFAEAENNGNYLAEMLGLLERGMR